MEKSATDTPITTPATQSGVREHTFKSSSPSTWHTVHTHVYSPIYNRDGIQDQNHLQHISIFGQIVNDGDTISLALILDHSSPQEQAVIEKYGHPGTVRRVRWGEAILEMMRAHGDSAYWRWQRPRYAEVVLCMSTGFCSSTNALPYLYERAEICREGGNEDQAFQVLDHCGVAHNTYDLPKCGSSCW